MVPAVSISSQEIPNSLVDVMSNFNLPFFNGPAKEQSAVGLKSPCIWSYLYYLLFV